MPRFFPILALVATTACNFAIDRDREDIGEDVDTGEVGVSVDSGSDGIDTDVDDPVDTSEGSIDIDGDGYASLNDEGVVIDCNDIDATVNPGELDDTCDGVDQDCDGVDGNDFIAPPSMVASACGGSDVDGDGYFNQDQSGEVIDCDDGNANINPGATEVVDNEVDENCDGVIEVTATENDVDGDGYESDVDCDDSDAGINPGALEVPYDDIDQDCDSTDLGDVDCDGYGKYAVDGSVLDCDDSDSAINKAATEILDNEVDENCDGVIEVTETENDIDGDGYESDVDCDDSDSAINPGASEVFDNVDNDCDGEINEDWQVVVKTGYPVSGSYDLSTALYSSGSVPNARSWYDENTSVTDDEAQVEYLTSEYGDVSGFCGVIINGDGYGLDDLCYGSSRDTSVAIDVWFDGVWYDEWDLEVWIADADNGSCALILQVDSSSSCDPVNDTN